MPPPTEVRSLSGWGGRPRSTSRVVTPRSIGDLEILNGGTSGQIPRGLGRSYGDAGQLAGGTVVDMTDVVGVGIDGESGLATAMAGTSLGDVLNLAVPMGWFLPVTPGTRHVTVGGAIASDVHGKNHHRDGSFGQHIESLDLHTSDGRTITAAPGSDAFAATVGGMGLSGIIAKATLRLIPIETPWMAVDTVRADDLESVMTELVEADARHRYSVAWLDLSRSGRGRGVVSGADHAPADRVPTRGRNTKDYPVVSMPGWTPGVVNDVTVSLFNRLWYWRSPARETDKLASLDSFFYPLDVLGHWNRLYGGRGFLQYQFVVPHGEEPSLLAVAERLTGADTPVSLAVLKNMGVSQGGLLSFPIPGWTLAVDMPLGDAALATTLDDCDVIVANAGGRVYLAKDSRLRPDLMADMYPGLAEWKETRANLDPDTRMRSNLSERLRLVA